MKSFSCKMLFDSTSLHCYKALEHEQISGWSHPTSSDKFCRPQFTCSGFANWYFYLQANKTAITKKKKKKGEDQQITRFLS